MRTKGPMDTFQHQPFPSWQRWLSVGPIRGSWFQGRLATDPNPNPNPSPCNQPGAAQDPATPLPGSTAVEGPMLRGLFQALQQAPPWPSCQAPPSPSRQPGNARTPTPPPVKAAAQASGLQDGGGGGLAGTLGRCWEYVGVCVWWLA